MLSLLIYLTAFTKRYTNKRMGNHIEHCTLVSFSIHRFLRVKQRFNNQIERLELLIMNLLYTLIRERIVRYNVDGIKVGDDVPVILDQDGCAGVEEFKRGFLTSPGVDPTMIPEKWVHNHYRWIVWKLASMDRMKFGRACLPRYMYILS